MRLVLEQAEALPAMWAAGGDPESSTRSPHEPLKGQADAPLHLALASGAGEGDRPRAHSRFPTGKGVKSGYRTSAEGMQLYWRWNGGTISTNLDVIREMSV